MSAGQFADPKGDRPINYRRFLLGAFGYFAVTLIDFDYFKRINNTHGHAIGDKIFRLIAEIIRQQIRTMDSVEFNEELGIVRYGGEEFIVIMPDTNGVEAQVAMERLRTVVKVASFDFLMADIKPIVSVGVATLADETEGEELLQKADDALYQVKHAGRNRSVLAA